MNTFEQARGKWRGILLSLGAEDKFLQNKHGPCPFCGGTDRYRWDNKDGNGTFFCSQCGCGNGFDFISKLKGWDFKTAAHEVDKLIGNIRADPIRRPINKSISIDRMRRLWDSSHPLNGSDPVSTYLSGRNASYIGGSCLRYHPNCPMPYGDGYAPAMLALVRDMDGKAINIHRTYICDLDTGEKRKRAMMAGSLTDGCAVRLFAAMDDSLGIAEGIETAISASKLFDIPVWAAINATMLEKWMPPDTIKNVVVFGDNDVNFAGQKSAYILANKLHLKGINVDIKIPEKVGDDWNDVCKLNVPI